MISERQQKILHTLIKEYLSVEGPVSSDLLKKKTGLDVSPATIRNELQDLTEKGYLKQPHTSAGRVPTDKGYEYFIQITLSQDKNSFPDFIVKEIEITRQKINQELQLAQELARSLEELHALLNTNHMQEDHLFEVLRIIGAPEITYDKNIEIMRQLLEKFEKF
jgi:heat-inducible transcriptional repressor